MQRKKVAVSLAAVMMALTSVGCAQTQQTPVNVDVKMGTPDYSQATGVLDIDAWQGPKGTEAAYQEYADCGYNMVLLENGNVKSTDTKVSDDKVNALLDKHFTLAKSHGMRLILGTNCPAQEDTNGVENKATPFEWIYQRHKWVLDKWKDDETFYGYRSWDEPFFIASLPEGDPEKLQRAYDDYADFYHDDYMYFSEKFPGKTYTITLCHAPNLGSKMHYQERFKDFEEYVEHYCQKVLKYRPYDDRALHMDAYPFILKTGTTDQIRIRDCAVTSLEIMGYIAEKYHAEKWCAMQNHELVYNTASVLYQYYTSMVYGYTHFTTYIYGEPSWYYPQHSITKNGERTDNWYYYQEAHEELRSFENVYREFTDDWQGALAYNGSLSTVTAKPWAGATKLLTKYHRIDSVTNTQDLMIGVMRDKNGYEGFMVSNQVEPFANTKNNVEITFNQATKALVYQDGKEGKIVTLDNGKITLTMKSGGGAFIIPIKEA